MEIIRVLLASGLLFSMSSGMVFAVTITLFDDQLPLTTINPSVNANGYARRNVRINTSPFDAFRVKETELASQDLPKTIIIALPDGRVAKAVYERFETGSGGSIIWIGHINNHAGNPVHLAINGLIVQGNITLNGQQFEIRYANGTGGRTLHSFEHIDPDKITPEHEPGPLPVAPPSRENNKPAGKQRDSGEVIDVLVIWAPNAETAVGGAAAMSTLIDLALSETNTGYINSNVTHRINLVHSQQIAYNSTFSTSDDLIRLQNPSDTYMDNVHTLRDTYKADLVQFIGDYAGISCGTAYVGATAPYAFSLTSYDCTAGKYSFGHELGHNLGADHDRQTKGLIGSSGGYGYGHYVASENWRTIMSYNNADCLAAGNCTRLNFWSNPAVNNPTTGSPTGIPEGAINAAENWKQLNIAANTIANFRASGDSYEPDDNATQASTITTGTPQIGHSIHNGGMDIDWATFVLSDTSDITLHTSGATGDTRMWLYDETLTEVAFDDDIDPEGPNRFSSIVETGLIAGTYYVKVDEVANNHVINDYTLTFHSTFSDDSYEPDDTFAEARLLEPGVPATGHNINGFGGDFDYTTFTLTCETDVVIETSGVSGDTILTLYDALELEIDRNNDGGTNTFSQISRSLPAGIYYVRVEESSQNAEIADYTLNLTASPCMPALCNGLPITVDLNLGQTTTPDNDVVLGSPFADVIRGKGGDDTICGMGGDDFIHGNTGNDWIDGGDGVDNLRGGRGNDTIYTGAGATVGTNSRVFGGHGNDTIYGGDDADDLRGGAGNDWIYGGVGDDEITGNSDDDIIAGQGGNDILNGGNGDNDELYGGIDDDSLNGGGGSNDYCDVGEEAADMQVNCEVGPAI